MSINVQIEPLLLSTKTPLHTAVQSHFAEIIPTLLDHGAKIDAVCMSNTILQFGKYTPLLMAARFGYSEAMNILMDRGASLSLKDELGNVPLESCLITFKPQIQDAKKALMTFAYNLH